MSPGKWTLEETITWSVEQEWPAITPQGLIAYSYAIDRPGKNVALIAHFDAAPSDDEKDDLWDVEGAVLAQLPDGWYTVTTFEILTPGQLPTLPPGAVLYRRGDKETPWHRWGARHPSKTP